MQRASSRLIAGVFVLLLNLGSQTTPGGMRILARREMQRSLRPLNRHRRLSPRHADHQHDQHEVAITSRQAHSQWVHRSEQEQFKQDTSDDWAAQEMQHEVSITNGFYMGVYPVTQEEYEQVMGKNPSCFRAAGTGKDKVAGLDTRRFPVE